MTTTIDSVSIPNFAENLTGLVSLVASIGNPTLSVLAQGFTFALIGAGETTSAPIDTYLTGRDVTSVIFDMHSGKLFKNTEKYILECLALFPYTFLKSEDAEDYLLSPSGQILLTSIQSEALVGFTYVNTEHKSCFSTEQARQRSVIFWLFVDSICGLAVPTYVKTKLLSTLDIGRCFYRYIKYEDQQTLVESMYHQLTTTLPDSYAHALSSVCSYPNEPGVLFAKLQSAKHDHYADEEKFYFLLYKQLFAPHSLHNFIPKMDKTTLVTETFFGPLKDVTVVKELLRWGFWVFNTDSGSGTTSAASRRGWYSLLNAYLTTSTLNNHSVVKNYLSDHNPAYILNLARTIS